MKTTVTIFAPARPVLGNSRFAELARLCPEAATSYVVHCELPADDPRVQQVLNLLKSWGFEPWRNTFRERGPNEFSMRTLAEFDEQELAAARYLVLKPRIECEGYVRNEKDRIHLHRKRLKKSADFARAWGDWLVVPDRVKRTLETSGLRGITFQKTVLTVEDAGDHLIVPWNFYGKPWWELLSDVTLPPMSAKAELYDKNGRRLKAGTDNFSEGCYLRDGFNETAQLRYEARMIQRLEEFDLARTHERFGVQPSEHDRNFVVSARFYAFCKKQRWKTSFVPVQLV